MRVLLSILLAALSLLFIFLSVAIVVKTLSPNAAAQELGRWGSWSEHGDYYNHPSGPQYFPEDYDWDFDFGEDRELQSKPFIMPVAPRVVSFPNEEAVGTIIINSKTRKLHLTLDQATAYEYPIAVGREGFKWSGVEKVSRVVEWPTWTPTQSMRQRDRSLPIRMAGGIRNPLGAVAIYLGNTEYRIHGTNQEETIGDNASSGCFRMYNEHAVHLASLVRIGATVKVY